MTLFELAVTVSLVGVVAGLAMPAVAAEADRARVVAAQSRVLDAYRFGQASSGVLGRTVTVTVTPDSVVVTTGPADSAVLLRQPGPAALGVTLTPALHNVAFEPSGMAAGAANTTHQFTRGAIRRQLILSRLGRIRVN